MRQEPLFPPDEADFSEEGITCQVDLATFRKEANRCGDELARTLHFILQNTDSKSISLSELENTDRVLSLDSIQSLISDSITNPLCLLLLSLSTKEKKQKKSWDREAFDEFWEAYPRKVAKQAARRAFKSLSRLDQQLAPGRCAVWFAANRLDMQYTPHPATWLRQQRWEDELHSESGALSQKQQRDRFINSQALRYGRNPDWLEYVEYARNVDRPEEYVSWRKR